MWILNCQYCGEEVERILRVKKVTCFDCKGKRMRKVATDYYIKKRKDEKDN